MGERCEVGLNVHGCESAQGDSVRTSCYSCGGPACRVCSAVVTGKRMGRVIRFRRCNDCAGYYQGEEQRDGQGDL